MGGGKTRGKQGEGKEGKNRTVFQGENINNSKKVIKGENVSQSEGEMNKEGNKWKSNREKLE